MRKYFVTARTGRVLIFSLGVFLFVCTGIFSFFPRASAQSVTGQRVPAVVASIPYWDQDRAFASFRKNVDSIDAVSLFWYTIDRNGLISRYHDAHIDHRIVTFAHQHGVQVFLLIANLPDESGTTWDWQQIDPILLDAKKQERFIGQALQLVGAKGADGITLDFESVRERQRVPFSRFVAKFARALHAHKKLLRVSVERRATSAYTNGKDWLAIATAADQLAIMSYDEHAEGTQPGHSSTSWNKGKTGV